MTQKYVYEKDRLPKPVIAGHEDWITLYYKAWELAFKNIEYVPKEGWKPQLTCMPGVGTIWQWDSCFMTFITNYSNGTLSALNNLDNIYRLQRKSDGFIGMAYRYSTDKEAFPGRINPPLFAWAEWEHFLISGDSSRFEYVLPILEGLYSFIENNRKRSNGLYWFEDPGSSGMDNAPRGGYAATHLDGNDICHIDLAAQQALSAYCLYQMFSVLKNSEKEGFYRDEYTRICSLINHYHWSEKAGFYFDFFARSRPESKVKFLNTKTMAAAWTVLAGVAKGERLRRISDQFFDASKFYTKIPFASLAADDPNYDATGGYWLGGVWAPTNYALVRGLKNSGYEAAAHEAAVQYLNGVSGVYKNKEFATIWEAYAPEACRPSTCEDGTLVRRDFVGWSGLGPITMLIENIIGLGFDARENTVSFKLSDYAQSGIENLYFNGGYISVVCRSYNPVRGGSQIYVKAEKPFTLHIEAGYLADTGCVHAEAGEHVYWI